MRLFGTAVAALLLPTAFAVGGAAASAPERPALADPAGACQHGHGVTVVLEPGSLGGRTEVSCDASGGGRTAARIFADVGHELRPVSSSPDFVCRVDDRPADASCAQVPPADAYWSLWWSDGSTPWTYASLAAGGLTVPDGGAVAFTWVDGRDDGTPATRLAGIAGSPDGPEASDTATPSDDSPDDSPDDSADDSGGSLPGWVAPVVVVVILGSAGGVALARRRRP